MFAENWDSVLMFLACSTCWRRDIPPMGGQLIYSGLRYFDCEVVIRNHGHSGKKAHGIFRDLQTLEAAALPILNKSK